VTDDAKPKLRLIEKPAECEHRGQHEHACSSVWIPEIRRVALTRSA